MRTCFGLHPKTFLSGQLEMTSDLLKYLFSWEQARILLPFSPSRSLRKGTVSCCLCPGCCGSPCQPEASVLPPFAAAQQLFQLRSCKIRTLPSNPSARAVHIPYQHTIPSSWGQKAGTNLIHVFLLPLPAATALLIACPL